MKKNKKNVRTNLHLGKEDIMYNCGVHANSDCAICSKLDTLHIKGSRR